MKRLFVEQLLDFFVVFLVLRFYLDNLFVVFLVLHFYLNGLFVV